VCADIRESSTQEAADSDFGNTTAELINGLYVRTDVSSSHDMRILVQRTIEEYGRLDMYVGAGLRGISVAGMADQNNLDSSTMPV